MPRAKLRQVKFYCDEPTYQVLQTEKVRHGKSARELLTFAINNTLVPIRFPAEASPTGGEQAVAALGGDKRQTQFDFGDEVRVHADQVRIVMSKRAAPEVLLWLECMKELPEGTVKTHTGLMRDTLRFFRSSRLKARSLPPGELAVSIDDEAFFKVTPERPKVPASSRTPKTKSVAKRTASPQRKKRADRG